MADFRNRVLGVLDYIYGFLGQKKAVDSIQLAQPAQLVHDLSREAELGSAFGRFRGLALISSQVTHVGASTENGQIDPYASVLTTGTIDPVANPTEDNLDLWLLGITCYVSAANMNQVEAAICYPAIPPTASSTYNIFPIMQLGQDGVVFAGYTGAANYNVMVTSNADELYASLRPLMRPIYLPHGSRISTHSNSAGAVVAEWRVLVWAGRKGTAPPGMR